MVADFMSDKLCARSACKEPGADHWNPSTRAFYCEPCARKINEGAGYRLCINPINMPPKETING